MVSVVSAVTAVSATCLLFGILLLYHWQLQRALVFRIVDQSNVGRLRILRGLEGHNSAAVVVLLRARAIWAMYEEPQTASLCDSPGEKCEIVEDVFLRLSRSDKLLLP